MQDRQIVPTLWNWRPHCRQTAMAPPSWSHDQRHQDMSYCREAAKQALRILFQMHRGFAVLTPEIIRPQYLALARSFLEYGLQALAPHLWQDVDMMERLQRLATRKAETLSEFSYLLTCEDLYTARAEYASIACPASRTAYWETWLTFTTNYTAGWTSSPSKGGSSGWTSSSHITWLKVTLTPHWMNSSKHQQIGTSGGTLTPKKREEQPPQHWNKLPLVHLIFP